MYYLSERGLTDDSLRQAVSETLRHAAADAKRILILPPDFTRMYSGAGRITAMIVDEIGDRARIDVMPALGTHAPMTREECEAF
ncbi:MAG: DUF2088 domain-containing protein, partial [Clostridia bacterium]|nr:DUF2088 domain-containing protein [Clostridia bacterium]